MGPPDDPNLTPADEPQMAISEMAVILMSAGVAPANFKVARIVLQKQIWRVSRRHGLRARPRGGLCDRLEHE